VRAVTRIETERICVHKWKGKSLWCPRERETVRDRRGQLEREKGSLRKKKTEEIVASSIRLLDAGRWVGSECCSSWRQNPDPKRVEAGDRLLDFRSWKSITSTGYFGPGSWGIVRVDGRPPGTRHDPWSPFINRRRVEATGDGSGAFRVLGSGVGSDQGLGSRPRRAWHLRGDSALWSGTCAFSLSSAWLS